MRTPAGEFNAFPLPQTSTTPAEYGMTLRDYFAAGAPAEPQSWFWPQPLTPRPDAVWPYGQTKAFRSDEPINMAEINAWDQAQILRRHALWPWAWADFVIAHRDATWSPE
jgi:hypothetical protein